MTRAELEAAIARLVDAERAYREAMHAPGRAAKLIPALCEVNDARDDLQDLLRVLDHELAFTPPESAVAS